MIDWVTTLEKYGVGSLENCRSRKTRICVRCDDCGALNDILYRSTMKLKMVDDDYPTRCRKCIAKDEKHIIKLKKASIALWNDDGYRKRNLEKVKSESNRKKLSKNSKRQWENAILTDAQINTKSELAKKQWKDQEFRNKIVESSKSMWSDEELKRRMLKSRRTIKYRENQRNKALSRWKDPEYIKKQNMAAAKANRCPDRLSEIRRNQSKVSKLQDLLYGLLDDLGIFYYREYNNKEDDLQCKIGPYSLDCVIPRENGKDILIDVHGEYWHGRSDKIAHDTAKESYIHNNLPDHEYRVIWEIEFLQGSARKTLMSWLGLNKTKHIDFKFVDVNIEEIDRKQASHFLAKYHYLCSIGRYGQTYGSILDGKILSVSVFTPPVRQNHPKHVRELSRFCIHPSYHKKNFASWFLSRCIKSLDKKYSDIIAFSDLTFDHHGTMYLASNFILDGTVRPDYWYVSDNKWVMHKKTLYNHAVKLRMKESDYADLHGYRKTYGAGKLRFRYHRNHSDRLNLS